MAVDNFLNPLLHIAQALPIRTKVIKEAGLVLIHSSEEASSGKAIHNSVLVFLLQICEAGSISTKELRPATSKAMFTGSHPYCHEIGVSILLRGIFGNPYSVLCTQHICRPKTLNVLYSPKHSNWKSSKVTQLVRYLKRNTFECTLSSRRKTDICSIEIAWLSPFRSQH